MGKGEQTRQAILEEAMAMASQIGLGGLSIGGLAERTGMSKSGLFAHFGSKEDMQLAVMALTQDRFADRVVRPALKEPRGLPRLRAMLRNWLGWTLGAQMPGGCLLIAASTEFDDQPGPVRDAVAEAQMAWRGTLARAVRQAVEEGQLRPDTDVEQFVFELVGIAMAAHQGSRLLKDRDAAARAVQAFERLVQDHAPERPRRRKE
ncbi:MAG: TetR family transcriptional regulator C-terminal domain-containing protein [Pseudomonadota bacterium]